MRTTWTTVCLLLLLTLPQAFHSSCSPDPNLAAPAGSELSLRFQNGFRAAQAQGFNGVALVARNGKILYLEALGVRDADGAPLKTDSPFNLASVSKPITATAILMLAEQDRLSLDDKASQFLPEMAGWNPSASNITIRQLLNHTSGLADYEDYADEFFEESNVDSSDAIEYFVDNRDIVRMFSELRPPQKFSPGSDYSYSNTGYLLLGSIIEKASDQSYADFLNQNLFRPLKMKKSSVCVGRKQPSDKARGFIVDAGNREPYDVEYLDGIYGDGNICASAEDLLKFDAALRAGKLLKSELAEEATRPATLNNGEELEYGYGWELGDDGLVFHTGSWTGFRTYFLRYDDGLTVIVLDNSSNENLYDQVDSILEDALESQE